MTQITKTTEAVEVDPNQSSAGEMKTFDEKLPMTPSNEGQSITPSSGNGVVEDTTTPSGKNGVDEGTTDPSGGKSVEEITTSSGGQGQDEVTTTPSGGEGRDEKTTAPSPGEGVAKKNDKLSFGEVTRNKWFRIAQNISKYWFISLFPIMFICNILSFFVMNLKHNRKLSTCTYMSAIAASDTTVLVHQITTWVLLNFGLISANDWFCKLYICILHTLWAYLSYLIVFMTLDKLIAIVLPHKAALLCTAKRARITSVVIFVVIVVFFIPVLYSAGHKPGMCARYAREGWYVTAYMYVSMIVNPVVPFVSITVMNSFILYTICKRKNTELGQSSIAHKVESQLTVMLVLICTTYLVLTFPFEFRELYMYYVGYSRTPVAHFVFKVTFELMMLNSGINFFLYLMSGRKFRNDIKMLL